MGPNSNRIPYEQALDSFRTLFQDIAGDTRLLLDATDRSNLELDLAQICQRLEAEGDSYLIKVLPAYAQAVERWCGGGNTGEPSLGKYLCDSLPFLRPLRAKWRASGASNVGSHREDDARLAGPGAFSVVWFGPAFLSTLAMRIDAGCPRPYPRMVRAIALRHLRQICYLWYKYEAPHDPATEAAVVENFVRTEDNLVEDSPQGTHLDALFEEPWFREASKLCRKVLSGVDYVDIQGKHGPGAVATGEKRSRKWTFSEYYRSVHSTYPWYDYLPLSARSSYVIEGEEKIWGRNPSGVRPIRHLNLLAAKVANRIPTLKDFPTASVVLVPKDGRGPRLISMEPLSLQYLQQGLMRNLTPKISELTNFEVRFRDQTANQNLAVKGSRDGSLATIDLKDASDRVTCALVRALFGDTYYKYFAALRSHATILPDGRKVVMKKYAPMGSALCFPVLSLCVWAIAKSIVGNDEGRQIAVFGDDLIVPTDSVRAVILALESVGLMVNVNKSFSGSGPGFRESCGKDAYMGFDVTPTRFKTVVPREGGSLQPAFAWAELASNLLTRGYANLAGYCKSLAEGCGTGEIPYTPVPCGILSVVRPGVNTLRLVRRGRGTFALDVITLSTSVRKEEVCPFSRLAYSFDKGKHGHVGEFPDRVVARKHRALNMSWYFTASVFG